MKIVEAYPPNYEKIKEAFDLEGARPVFSYGGTIFNPHRIPITDDLVVHENTHFQQQVDFGGVDKWWDEYMSNPDFRLAQEIEAYKNQYKFFCNKNKDRNVQNRFLHNIAGALSGQMYGGVISYNDALMMVKK